MAEFTGGNEKYISTRGPIVFENETESKYEVCTGIVFHKSGVYEVSIVGNRTIVSEVPKRKTGKWIKDDFTGIIKCDQCGNDSPMDTTGGGQYESNFCPNCGADMNPLPESYKPKEKNDACD